MRNLIILAGLLFFVFVNPAGAISITEFTAPDGMFLKDSNTFLVVENNGKNVTEYHINGDPSEVIMSGFNGYLKDIAVDSQGRLILSVWGGSGDGFIYRVSYPSSEVVWSELSPSQITTLGIFTNGVDQIVIDGDDNIYVDSRNDLYVLSNPTYSSTLLHTFSRGIGSLAVHPDGIVVGSNHLSATTGYTQVDLYYPNNDTVLNIDSGYYGTDYQAYVVDAVGATTNGDIYVSMYTYATNMDLDDGTNDDKSMVWWADASNGYYTAKMGETSTRPGDMVITPDGVFYVSYPGSNTIITYSTDGLYGGYNFLGSGDSEETATTTPDAPYVIWDSSYVLDDVGSFTWEIDNTNWADDDYIYKCIVTRISDNGQYDEGVYDSGELTTQNGTQDIIFDTETAYTVALKKYSVWDLYLGVLFEPDVLYEDTITITAGGPSQINAPSSAQRGEAFDISYNYGYTPIDPQIRIKKLEGIQYNVISTIDTTESPEAGTTYTAQGTIYETGYYVIELYDNSKGSQATDTINIIYTYVPPENPINDNFINVKKDSYALGEFARGSYAIDDANFTTYDVRLEVYNTDKSIMAFSVPAVQQMNSYDIGLFDYHLYDDGEQLHPVNTQFMAGAHTARLTAYHSNGTQALIINSDTFTITDVTTEGYGLILSKGEVDQGEQFIISAVSPTSANIIVRDENDILIKSMAINGSIDVPYSLAKPGYYTIELLTNQELKAHQLLKVRDNGEVWNPGTGETTTGDQGTAIYTNFINFMTLPIFWGIIIFIGVVGGMAQIKDMNKQSLGYIAFVFLNLFAIAGLFAPYTAYVLVMGWIAAGIFFSVGRRMAGGDY